MNQFKNYLVFVLSLSLQGNVHTAAFFWDGQEPRAGLHYDQNDLFRAHTNLSQILPNHILTSIDPETSVARIALITQNSTNGPWNVQYYLIKDLPSISFPSLLEAQEFTLALLESGPILSQQQTIPSAGAPQKAVFQKKTPRAWRKAHV